MSEGPAAGGGAPRASWWRPATWPFIAKVASGVVLGAATGLVFGRDEIVFGLSTATFATMAGLYIRLLTMLATPLIFFAIADAFVRTEIAGRDGLRMFAICAANIAVAFVIGLTLLNVWQPGRTWEGRLGDLGTTAAAADGIRPPLAPGPDVSLSPLAILDSYVPRSLAQPFAENMVLTVAVMAILLGAALRRVKRSPDPAVLGGVETVERVITVSYQVVLTILHWVIALAPYAICLAVAGVVGSTGAAVFAMAGSFYALVYYPLSAWLIGGKSPRRFFGIGGDAILTGFSINSSLATAPLTLDALERMGVSDSSARLSACIGTNFNNDGITLYEAITALFIAQAAGLDLSLTAQAMVLLAALAGSMGIAGIPNSGLIILALVLKAAHLPEDVVQLALPIVYSVDFVNARLRSAVNVMGDMQVAILLDATRPAGDGRE
jgi:DAACS family dicarboxylate/amino acid:cation (Na+ or H+) symporter